MASNFSLYQPRCVYRSRISVFISITFSPYVYRSSTFSRVSGTIVEREAGKSVFRVRSADLLACRANEVCRAGKQIVPVNDPVAEK